MVDNFNIPTDTEVDQILQDTNEEQLCATIVDLLIYPLKSAKPIKLNTLEFDIIGPKFDRKWLITDEKGKAATLRRYTQIILIEPSFEDENLVLRAPGMDPLKIPLQREYPDDEIELITHFDATGTAIEESPQASAWVTKVMNHLDKPFRLMREAPGIKRRVADIVEIGGVPRDHVHDKTAGVNGFTDITSVLTVSVESVADLNGEIQKIHPEVELSYEDFRPNLVFSIEGGQAYAEDTFDEFRIGDVFFHSSFPRMRCRMTTIDKKTGKVRPSKEPLITLRKYRNSGGVALMGQNAHHTVKSAGGTIIIGDKVHVRKFKTFPHPLQLGV